MGLKSELSPKLNRSASYEYELYWNGRIFRFNKSN